MEGKESQDPTYKEAAKQAIRRKIKEDAPKLARMYQLVGQPHARKLLSAIDEIDKDPDILTDQSGEKTNEVADKVVHKKPEE